MWGEEPAGGRATGDTSRFGPPMIAGFTAVLHAVTSHLTLGLSLLSVDV